MRLTVCTRCRAVVVVGVKRCEKCEAEAKAEKEERRRAREERKGQR